MRICIVNQYGQIVVRDANAVPRIGDALDMFYEPLPTVIKVVWWPSPERLASINCSEIEIDALVVVA